MILNAGPSENVLIVNHPRKDHSERGFKRLIVGGNSGPTGKVF